MTPMYIRSSSFVRHPSSRVRRCRLFVSTAWLTLLIDMPVQARDAGVADAGRVPGAPTRTRRDAGPRIPPDTGPRSTRDASVPTQTFGATATVRRPPGPGETPEAGTGSRANIPESELPATVHTVESETMRERGLTDVSTSLQVVPSLTATRRYGGFLQLRSRGFSAVVLNDGRRDNRSTFVNSHPQGGIWDIDRIEVLKGPSTVLHGYGAVGGVVNVIRKHPSSDPEYTLDLGYGTPGTWFGHFGATGPVADDLNYRVDVGHTVDDDFRGNTSQRTQGTISLDYQPHPDHRLFLRALYYHNDIDPDTGIPTVEDDNGDRHLPPHTIRSNRYNTRHDFLHYHRFDLELGYEWQIHEHLKLRERFSYTRDLYEYLANEGFAYNDSVGPPQVDKTFSLYFYHHWYPINNQLELHADAKTGTVKHDMLAGYDITSLPNARSDRASNVGDFALPSVDFRHPVEQAPPIPIKRDGAYKASMISHSAFVQDHMTFPYRIHLLVGGRADVFSFETRKDRFDPATGNRVAKGREEDRRDVGFTYRAGLVQRPTGWLSLYGQWSTAFKPNASLGLSSQITDEQGNAIGFDEVEPARGEQFEGGARVLWQERVELDLAGYWIRKDNVSIPAEMNRTETAGEVQSRGLEVDLTARYDPVSVRASYGLTDAQFEVFRNRDGEDLSGNRPAFAPEHTASLWVTYRPTEWLGLALGGRALGEQFADEENHMRLDPYVLADASAWIEVDPVRFTLTVRNMFDNDDYFVDSVLSNLTPGPPREALAQLRVQL